MLRERGCAILQMIMGTKSAYKTAKRTEGAKSRASGTPPTEAGNSGCIDLADICGFEVDEVKQPGEESMHREGRARTW